jgi:hypothetical protein
MGSLEHQLWAELTATLEAPRCQLEDVVTP